MEAFNFVASTGRPYQVTLPDPHPSLESAYIFAFFKSGSTLIHDMVRLYCKKVGVPTFSLYDIAFQQGVPTGAICEDAATCFKKYGYIYLGFRHFPNFDIDLNNTTALLLARDPRDMLVSLYYSVRSSHVIPRGNERLREQRDELATIDIDAYVLGQKDLYKEIFARYRRALRGSNLTVYRYEDVIYEKEKWLIDVVDKLGLDCIPRQIAKIAKSSDIFPKNEDEKQHIRQVHPGNYKEKLSGSTIEILNETLKDYLAYFNYAL